MPVPRKIQDPNTKRAPRRPKRASMDGDFRDLLTVRNPDPMYTYRWILDKGDGSRVNYMRNQQWELVSNNDFGEESAKTGSSSESKDTKSNESVTRVPGGAGQYHYLMRIYKDWYDEDQMAKAKATNMLDSQIHNKRYNADYSLDSDRKEDELR